MKILMKVILAIILTSSTTTTMAFAQTKKFRWATDLCEYDSTYDAKKHTPAQIKDTHRLLHLDFFPDTIDATERKKDDAETLRLEKLDAEYEKRTTELKNLKIVKTAYWENLQRKHLRELEQVYQLSRATILSYENPERLNDVEFSGACQTKYAAPLIKGGDDLLATWRTINEESRRQNGSPDDVRRKFEAQYNSPERLWFARIEVTTFGWWNCVNALIDRENRYDLHEKEFRELFIRTKTLNCEEP